jgi:hypothetical protein
MTWIIASALREWKVLALVFVVAFGSLRLYQSGVKAEAARNQIATLENRNKILALDAVVQKAADAVQEKSAADLESKLALQDMQLREYENELKKHPNFNCAISLDDLKRLRGF